MEINKDSAIWHAFGYHNAFIESNEDFKAETIGNNIVKGVSYIPFVGTVLLVPSLIHSIYRIKKLVKDVEADKKGPNDDTKEELEDLTKPYYKGMIIRAFFQAIPGSCLILIPVDIVFSALRYKEIITE